MDDSQVELVLGAAVSVAALVFTTLIIATSAYVWPRRHGRGETGSCVTICAAEHDTADTAPPVGRLPKPHALLLLGSVASKLFGTLKQRFQVGSAHRLNLDSVETVGVFDDPAQCAALTMRKLQLLYLIADPAHDVSSEVVVGICVELIRDLGELQSIAPDIALEIEAGLVPLQEALLDVTDALHRSPANRLVVFVG